MRTYLYEPSFHLKLNDVGSRQKYNLQKMFVWRLQFWAQHWNASRCSASAGRSPQCSILIILVLFIVAVVFANFWFARKFLSVIYRKHGLAFADSDSAFGRDLVLNWVGLVNFHGYFLLSKYWGPRPRVRAQGHLLVTWGLKYRRQDNVNLPVWISEAWNFLTNGICDNFQLLFCSVVFTRQFPSL